MKFLHGLFEFLVFLTVLLLGTLCIYGMTNSGKPYWDFMVRILQSGEPLDRLMVLMGGIGLILLVVLYLLTSARKQKDSKMISFQGHSGPVTINLKAVRDVVLRTGDEFTEIISMQPNLEFRGGGLYVELDVRVMAGAHVPELCQQLQERVTDCVHDQLGLKEVKAVKVNIRELVKRSAPVTTMVDKEVQA